jgi:two-component system, NarL family, response regulator DevR
MSVRRVRVVDDHELVRKGVRAILGSRADLDAVGEAAEEGEAMAMTIPA